MSWIQNTVSPPTLSLFRVVLATPDPLHSHINFRISLLISKKKIISLQDFYWDCLGSIDQCAGNLHLIIPKHGISLHLFRPS